MTDYALEVNGLVAGYGETTVIRELSLEIARGETLVVIGPNGHGKTTLLNAISGLADVREGTVTVAGDPIQGLRAEQMAAEGVVHVPQGDMLFPSLTVEENLLMGAFPANSWKRKDEALQRAYELFPALVERAGSEARTLSGGERRQTALGRGLMREAEVYLIDEPSLGLAPVIVDRVYEVIKEISRTSSVLLVEENFNHIDAVADRVSVLELGRIVRTGTVAELSADETVAASYLGTVTVDEGTGGSER
jgi:branched-chain amino acid transport system ATP-binding protein